jgi:hypothetical protein
VSWLSQPYVLAHLWLRGGWSAACLSPFLFRLFCSCWRLILVGLHLRMLQTPAVFCWRTSAFPNAMIAVWSAKRNSSLPQRAATRFPQITVDAVQLCSAVAVGLGIASPAAFTGSQANSLCVSSTLSTPKRAGRNSCDSLFSISENSLLSPSVTCCKDCHYACKDFCKPT